MACTEGSWQLILCLVRPMTRTANPGVLTVALFAIGTAAVVGFAWSWALPPLFSFVSFMSDHSPTDVEIIDRFWPTRIVQPAWFAGDHIFLPWSASETGARLILLLVAWVAFSAWLFGRWRSSRHTAEA